MRFRHLRYRTRALLLAVLSVACVMAIGVEGFRIHDSVASIEASGGDVWMGETLYRGAGFGNIKPRTKTEQQMNQAAFIARVLLGQETELWLTSIPEERDDLLQWIDRLNTTSVTFDVLGETERDWISNQLPFLALSPDCAPRFRANPDAETNEHVPSESPARGLAQDDFVSSMESVQSLFDANPQLMYRLDRYEPLIGFPTQGEMGRLRDKHTGNIISLPWPK